MPSTVRDVSSRPKTNVNPSLAVSASSGIENGFRFVSVTAGLLDMTAKRTPMHSLLYALACAKRARGTGDLSFGILVAAGALLARFGGVRGVTFIAELSIVGSETNGPSCSGVCWITNADEMPCGVRGVSRVEREPNDESESE